MLLTRIVRAADGGIGHRHAGVRVCKWLGPAESCMAVYGMVNGYRTNKAKRRRKAQKERVNSLPFLRAFIWLGCVCVCSCGIYMSAMCICAVCALRIWMGSNSV